MNRLFDSEVDRHVGKHDAVVGGNRGGPRFRVGIDVVVLALDRPVVAQRIFGAETDDWRKAGLVPRSCNAKNDRRSIGRLAEIVLLVQHSQAGLRIYEPAFGRETGAAGQHPDPVDPGARNLDLRKIDGGAAECNSLSPRDVCPRSLEFSADDEAADLLVDADLAADQRTTRDKGRVGAISLPVLHAAAIAGMRADIDAAPVEGGGNDRLRLDGKVGGDSRPQWNHRTECCCSQPRCSVAFDHAPTPSQPSVIRKNTGFPPAECCEPAT